jgi:hypothetical protein
MRRTRQHPGLRALRPFLSLFALLLLGQVGCVGGDNKSRFYTYCDRNGCFQCDERGCGAIDGLPPGAACKATGDCAPGCYCSADGTCAEAGFCDRQEDCAKGFVCNVARHSCEPTGAGGGGGGGEVKPQACKVAADCPPAGECVNGVCRAAPVLPNHCVFNRQCGGGVCVDGRCERACQDDTACGTGRTCQAGRCQPRPAGAGSCIGSNECGAAQECINGACHLSCSKDGDCQAVNANDVCVSGRCRANEARVAECRMNKDCAAGRECVDALCRDFCFASSDCAGCADGPVCAGGYCMTAKEANPQCRLPRECTNNAHCVDGSCQK